MPSLTRSATGQRSLRREVEQAQESALDGSDAILLAGMAAITPVRTGFLLASLAARPRASGFSVGWGAPYADIVMTGALEAFMPEADRLVSSQAEANAERVARRNRRAARG